MALWFKSAVTRIGIDKVRRIYIARLNRVLPSHHTEEVDDFKSQNEKKSNFVIRKTVHKKRHQTEPVAYFVVYFTLGLVFLMVFLTIIYMAGERIFSPSKEIRKEYEELQQSDFAPKNKQLGSLAV